MKHTKPQRSAIQFVFTNNMNDTIQRPSYNTFHFHYSIVVRFQLERLYTNPISVYLFNRK